MKTIVAHSLAAASTPAFAVDITGAGATFNYIPMPEDKKASF